MDHLREDMDPGLDFSTTQQLLTTLVSTGQAIHMSGITGDMADLREQWARHVEEAEGRLFPQLVARGPAADKPVEFCLAEHAVLGSRLAELETTRGSRQWLREAELLIGQLIQHLFLEARVLRPLVERTSSGGSTHRADVHFLGRVRP